MLQSKTAAPLKTCILKYSKVVFFRKASGTGTATRTLQLRTIRWLSKVFGKYKKLLPILRITSQVGALLENNHWLKLQTQLVQYFRLLINLVHQALLSSNS